MGLVLLAALLLGGAPLHVAAAPAEADMYAEAESRYLGRNYTAALESYNAFAQAWPLSERMADVQYRRAVCIYRLGRARDALAVIADIETRWRSTRWIAYVPLWKGLSLYATGSPGLAVESLDAFIAGTVDAELMPQALLHRALALHALGADARAVQSLRDLVGSYPASPLFPYASVLLGTLLQRAGDAAGLLALTQATDPAPFPAPWKNEFLLLEAEALWQAGRAEQALPLYYQLVGGTDDVALTSYGRLFSAAQARGDLQGMRDLTRAAETRFAGSTGVLSQLWTRVGVETFKAGAADAAEGFLRRAWDARATVPPAEAVPLYLAEISLARGDRAGAAAILQEGLLGSPRGTGAIVIRLGDVALMGDDYTAAAAYYQQFLASFASSRRAAEAGSLLAYCWYRMDRRADAARLVEDLLAAGDDPSLDRQLRRLRVVLANADGRTADAAAALRDYVARYPGDVRARLDLLKALFILQRNAEVVAEADALRRAVPGLAAQDPYAAVVASYLRGLALISTRDYRRAAEELALISADTAASSGLAVIVPYARYYLGWALLRSADPGRAAPVFDALAAAYPAHELSAMTVYLAGWSYFSTGNFAKAAASFSRGAAGSGEIAQKSLYLLAKSLMNQKRPADAVPVLQRVASSTPPSPWAADALFDLGTAHADLGQVRLAADAWKSLYDTYPDSPLREEALYRRGDAYMAKGMPAEARAAFDEYRARYPRGRLVDAALYWSGQAAAAQGQGMAAALFWEQLLAGWPDSTYRAAALQQTAEAYAQAGQYPKALQLYAQFLDAFPDEARAAKADIRTEQVRLLAEGAGDREAELSALIARETGERKRAATVELARLYIYAGDKRAEAGYRLLLPVVKEGSPAVAADAQALVGEYFYRRGDLAEAARQFLAVAALANVAPGDAAAAIYRAAEMMALAKRADDVAALVARLEAAFPGSEWTTKARLLSAASQGGSR